MKNYNNREDVRSAILDAANLLLARYGYKKMTIDDIAQEVGIGKGTVYLHFASKEEIALSHVDRIVEVVKEQLREIASDDAPPEDRLRRMLVERVLIRFDSVQHYTQSLNDLLASLRPRLLTRRRKHFEEEAQIFAAVLAEGQKLKIFAAGDALEIAQTLLLATSSLLPYSLSTKELGERDEIAQRVERLAKLLQTGVLARQAKQ